MIYSQFCSQRAIIDMVGNKSWVKEHTTGHYWSDAKAESVTEKMKENNQWEWIQRMGSIYNCAEEIVRFVFFFEK